MYIHQRPSYWLAIRAVAGDHDSYQILNPPLVFKNVANFCTASTLSLN